MYQDPHESQNQDDLVDEHYAGIWQRACATAIDTFVLANIMFAVYLIFDLQPIDPDANLIIWCINIAYFTGFLYSKQSTPGGMFMGLRVCDQAGGEIGLGQACIRSIMAHLSALILGMGYFVAAFSDKKQTLHDMAAKTYVKTEREQAEFKYLLYSTFLGIFVMGYSAFTIAVVIGIGTYQALVNGTGSLTKYMQMDTTEQGEMFLDMQISDSGGYEIENPKWISSQKRVKKKTLSKNQFYKKLRLRKVNRMPSRLAKMQARSNDKNFKSRKFGNLIPVKLKGVVIHQQVPDELELGILNNFFYNTLSFDILDEKNNKLKKFDREIYQKLSVTSYEFPNKKQKKDYKLRVLFPKKYTVVYFSNKDAEGTAYKLPTGTVVQLNEQFDFTILDKKNDLKKIRFIPLNSKKKVMSTGTVMIKLNQSAKVYFLADGKPIAYVAMVYLTEQEYFEVPFNIE